MSSLSVPPPLPSQPADFGIRLLAHLIDSALWTFLMMLVVMGLFGREILEAVRGAVEQASGGAVALDPHLFEPPLWFTVIFNYVLPVVVLVLLWKWKSATPGKMILGLKVVDADTGGKLSASQCIMRMLGYIPPLLPLTFLTMAMVAPQPMLLVGAAVFTSPLLWGFISILTDPRKQGWHDKLARTLVVRK
jgi:uncharacterized RDD family membrane protein YckC